MTTTHTIPVGQFQPNPFGLYQVHGNVWEWTNDCLNYAGAPTDGSASTSGDCRFRIRRGGSWLNHPTDLRSANRSYIEALVRDYSLGFRVARTLPAP